MGKKKWLEKDNEKQPQTLLLGQEANGCKISKSSCVPRQYTNSGQNPCCNGVQIDDRGWCTLVHLKPSIIPFSYDRKHPGCYTCFTYYLRLRLALDTSIKKVQ